MLTFGPASPSSGPGGEGFRVGPWWVDPPTGTVRHRDGQERHLRPQEMDLLSYLAAAAGRVVSREEILAVVWDGAAVEEGAISRCVSVIRKSLGDDAREPRYIETIPKRGYRLISQVDRELRESRHGGFDRRLLLVAAASALAIFAGIGLGPSRRTASTATMAGDASAAPAPSAAQRALADDRPAVAVLGFSNLSGAERLDWLSAALTEMLATELASTRDLRVVAGETVSLLKRELSLTATETLAPGSLERLRTGLGADVVVVGSYLAQDGAGAGVLRLDLKLQDTATGETVFGIAETGSLARLGDLVSATGVRLRDRLGSAPPDRSWSAPASHLPSDLEAMRLYAEGVGKLRRFEAAASRDLLLAAVSREPHQPLAHLALAEAWTALGHDDEAAEAARRAHSQRAKLPRELELWVEASYLAALRRWDEAIDLYDALWLFAPENLEYGLRLAATQNAANRPGDALATVRRIERRAERGHLDPRLALVTAEATRRLGDHDRSLTAASSAVELGEALQAPSMIAQGRYFRAVALEALGRFSEATRALGEARVAFAAAGDRRSEARADRTLAGWLTARGAYQEAEVLAMRSLKALQAIGDRKGEAEALRSIAHLEWSAGSNSTAEAAFRRAGAVYRELNDLGGEAEVLQGLGILKGSDRQVRESGELFHRALAIHRELGNREQASKVLANLGKLRLMEAAPVEADAHLREAEVLARELGLVNQLANVRFNQGWVSWLMGDPGRGVAAFREAIDLFRQLENPRMVAAGLQGLGEIHLLAGDLEAARTCVEEALERRLRIAQEEGAHAGSAMESMAVLSAVLLEQGQPDAAERAARRAVETVRDPVALASLARTFLAQERIAEARRPIQEAGELINHRYDGISDVRLRQRVLEARIEAVTGDPRVARVALGEVSSVARARGAWTLAAEAELSLAEIELSSGDSPAGIARLATLEAEARSRETRLVAEKARNARAGGGRSASVWIPP